MRSWYAVVSASAALLAACGSASVEHPAARVAHPARWQRSDHVPGIVDLTGRRRDGELTVAARGRLFLLDVRRDRLRPFARGPRGYATALGPEPYVASTTTTTWPPGADCAFRPDDTYALEPSGTPGVIRVDAQGRARRLADVIGKPTGIAFDPVGRFGHRLLVTVAGDEGTSIVAVDCRGRERAVTRSAPRVEGGIAVAPASFGAYAGDLIAADEESGRIVAVDAAGSARTIADSGLPRGGDVGVESAGFVPRGLRRSGRALVADRGVPGNAHPGTDSVLTLSVDSLVRAGVRPGDLLVATEGGAQTLAVRCRRSCRVTHIADGPPPAHVEGHIVFLGRG